MCVSLFFFFKQKTAYEMRISDWSSDVCSSDLQHRRDGAEAGRDVAHDVGEKDDPYRVAQQAHGRHEHHRIEEADARHQSRNRPGEKSEVLEVPPESELRAMHDDGLYRDVERGDRRPDQEIGRESRREKAGENVE